MSLCSWSKLTDHCPVPALQQILAQLHKKGFSFKIRQQVPRKEQGSFLLKVSSIQQDIMGKKSNSKTLFMQEPHLECTEVEISHL